MAPKPMSAMRRAGMVRAEVEPGLSGRHEGRFIARLDQHNSSPAIASVMPAQLPYMTFGSHVASRGNVSSMAMTASWQRMKGITPQYISRSFMLGGAMALR
jgi:hypothetical protein